MLHKVILTPLVLALAIALLATPAGTGAGQSPAAAAPEPPTAAMVTPDALTDALNRRADAVTLAFGGDVHFEGFLRDRLLADPAALLAPVAPLLSAADIAVVNLETTVTDGGLADPKQFTFRAPPEAFDALLAAGVDIVSVANNHGVDFGMTSLLDTMDAAAAAGMTLVGAGQTELAAYTPHVTTVRGVDVAVFGATDVLDGYAVDSWVAGPDEPGIASAKATYRRRLLDAVTHASTTNDVVVVMLHWGVEKHTCPTAAQQTLADELIIAGADVVVGGHAHRLQGGGWKRGAIVHYGLGNFVFYVGDGSEAAESGVFVVEVGHHGAQGYAWTPATLQSGVATPVEDDGWEALRSCTDLSADQLAP